MDMVLIKFSSYCSIGYTSFKLKLKDISRGDGNCLEWFRIIFGWVHDGIPVLQSPSVIVEPEDLE